MYNVIYINQISFTLNAKQISTLYPQGNQDHSWGSRMKSYKIGKVNEVDARAASVRNRAIENVLVTEIKVT